MCKWCVRSEIVESLTSGLSASRREFLAYAASFTLAAGTGLGSARAGNSADFVFKNGPIYPLAQAGGAKVDALAVGGGKILAAGRIGDMSSLMGSATKVIDLKGRTLLPGLIDPHNHTVFSSLLYSLLTNIGFSRCKTKDEATALMKATAAKTAPGDWMAFGFYDNLLQGGNYSMAELDAISTTSPIFVLYVNDHTGTANSLAFNKAKVTKDTGDLPGGGYFGHDSSGNLNGMIYNEPALLRFLDLAVTKPTSEYMSKAVTSYAGQAAAAGLTALHEPGTVKPEWVEMLAKLSNSLPIRLSASFSTDMVDKSKSFAALGPSNKARHVPNSRFSLYGMKYWGDGSNQAETAAQTKPYLDTDKLGKLSYTNTQAVDLCKKAKDAGWTILVHSQGDAAVDQVLDAIEAAYGANSSMGLNRIEHATMARQDQIDRMKALGCEASFMIDFVYLYGAAYRDKLFGPKRAEFMVPIGAAAKAGIGYSIHSDNPAAGLPLSPLRLIQTAVTRRCMVDNSVVGADVALTVDEALRGVTFYAARQMGLSDEIGSLESGKEADLTILESDPYTTDLEKIMDIKVSETWLSGEKKYG